MRKRHSGRNRLSKRLDSLDLPIDIVRWPEIPELSRMGRIHQAWMDKHNVKPKIFKD